MSHAGPTSPKRHADRIPNKRNNDSYIRWDNVHILQRNTYATLRHDGSPSHYYPARETDANYLRIATGQGKELKDETEKLLFYRGLGHFEAPLHLSMVSNEKKLRLRNTGKEPLSELYLLVVRNSQAKFERIDSLARQKDLSWNPDSNLRPFERVSAELAQALEETLVGQGLYRKEAKAMINTWRKPWFDETGVRVLYTLPEKWTDQALPLTVTPRPKEVVRVMVGRAELITPRMEWSLLREVVRYADEKQRAPAAAKLALGRFLEPTIVRLIKNNPSKESRLNAQRLQYALHHLNNEEHPVVSLLDSADRSGS